MRMKFHRPDVVLALRCQDLLESQITPVREVPETAPSAYRNAPAARLRPVLNGEKGPVERRSSATRACLSMPILFAFVERVIIAVD